MNYYMYQERMHEEYSIILYCGVCEKSAVYEWYFALTFTVPS